MKDNKIAFIICTNNAKYLDECIFYIANLNVPENFETEVISITQAEYMTKAYNEAINQCDAKYKVYLHQDVFIVNKNFIFDVLDIFADQTIGMIGTIGCMTLPEENHWLDNGLWDCGTVFINDVNRACEWKYSDLKESVRDVKAVDGMIMITQYDIPWREDIITGWDFYDISQCMEFLKKDFRVVVPQQERPWIMHDHGVLNYGNYGIWKDVFFKEYRSFIFELAKANRQKTEIGETKKLAVCVPTYNHPEVVDDVLSKSIRYYYEMGVDVYYYDSSTDDKTKEVIEKYQAQGYDNLYHIALDQEYEDKIYGIMTGQGREKKYKYVWPVKDRVYATSNCLKIIMETLEEGYELVFTGVINVDNQPDYPAVTYTNSINFYHDWGWLATSLHSAIYSEAFLNFAKEKLNKQDKEYRKYHCLFVYIFDCLADNPYMRVRVLRQAEIRFFESSRSMSTWLGEPFRVWKDCWIAANEALPNCYNEYKAYVIKTTASLPHLLGGVNRLLEYHKANVLNSQTVSNIEFQWEKVSDIPVYILRDIAFGRYDANHDISSIRNSKKEMVALYVELMEKVKMDALEKAEISFKNVISYIMAEASKRLLKEELNLLLGSVVDIQQDILRKDITKEETLNRMQQILTYLILL